MVVVLTAGSVVSMIAVVAVWIDKWGVVEFSAPEEEAGNDSWAVELVSATSGSEIIKRKFF